MENQKEKKTEEIFGTIMTKNYFSISVRHQFIHSRSSENTGQDKTEKIYTQVYHIQTEENQRQREKRKILTMSKGKTLPIEKQ